MLAQAMSTKATFLNENWRFINLKVLNGRHLGYRISSDALVVIPQIASPRRLLNQERPHTFFRKSPD